MNPKLKLLSHSSRLLLHACPRKYQLYRSQVREEDSDDISTSVTFAFGTVVGIGIQQILAGATEQEWILEMLQAWEPDLLDSNPVQKKSFFLAIAAVQKFQDIYQQGYLEDYKLVYIDNKPAIELSFQILLPDDFIYRGYVDAVLQNIYTGEIIVLELKTTSSTSVNPATYKNSGQAIGYSVVLDKIFPDLSSYTALYLVYSTKSGEYSELPFEKSLLQRALWIQELLIDCEQIKLYEQFEAYPMHGESCFTYYRECGYLGICTLSTEFLLMNSIGKEDTRPEPEYTYTVTLEDLVTSQIARGE